jgi:predicted  nucleic acid-binding Zn-ribbon protein
MSIVWKMDKLDDLARLVKALKLGDDLVALGELETNRTDLNEKILSLKTEIQKLDAEKEASKGEATDLRSEVQLLENRMFKLNQLGGQLPQEEATV